MNPNSHQELRRWDAGAKSEHEKRDRATPPFNCLPQSIRPSRRSSNRPCNEQSHAYSPVDLPVRRRAPLDANGGEQGPGAFDIASLGQCRRRLEKPLRPPPPLLARASRPARRSSRRSPAGPREVLHQPSPGPGGHLFGPGASRRAGTLGPPGQHGWCVSKGEKSFGLFFFSLLFSFCYGPVSSDKTSVSPPKPKRLSRNPTTRPPPPPSHSRARRHGPLRLRLPRLVAPTLGRRGRRRKGQGPPPEAR